MFLSIRRSTAALVAVLVLGVAGALPAVALAGATASKSKSPYCKNPSYAAKHKKQCKGGGRH